MEILNFSQLKSVKQPMEKRSTAKARPSWPTCLFLCVCLLFPNIIFAAPAQTGFPAWLTSEEKEFLSDTPDLRVGPDPFFPPIEYFDPQNTYQGISADFLSEVEKLLNIRFAIIEEKSWKAVIKKAQNREIDILGAAAKTPQRSNYLDFTKPYLTFPAVIITRKNVIPHTTMAELKGKKVGVTRGYAVHEYVQSHFPALDLHPVTSIDEGLNLLSYGQLDAMICINAPALYYLEKNGLTNLHVAGKSGYFLKLSLASRNDHPLLGSILTKALDHIPDSKKNAILSKWMGRQEAEPWQPNAFIVAVGLFIVSSIFLLAFVAWNKALRNQVNTATEKLREKVAELESNREKLDQSKEQFRGVFDNANVALVIHELDGNVHDMNQCAMKLFGVERSDIPNITIAHHLSSAEADLEKVTVYWEKAINFEDQNFQWRCRNSDTNQEFDARIYLTRIKHRHQNYILATIHSLAENYQYQQDRRQLMARVTPTLSKQLAELSEAVEEVQSKSHLLPSPDPILPAINRLSARVGEHNSFLSDFVESELIECDYIKLRPASLDIEAVLQETIQEISPIAEAHDLQIDFKNISDTLNVEMDPEQLRKIVRRFLSAAVTSTHHDTTVTVLLTNSAKGDHPEITCPSTSITISFVTDAGKAAELKAALAHFSTYLHHIESPFTSGLSFYNSHRILEMMGGGILFNFTPNVITTFTIVFPQHTI